MAPPPTSREQLELDELLSDIYRGIEAMPIRSHTQGNNSTYLTRGKTRVSNSDYAATTTVKHYELPANSPIVKQHKQAVAAMRAASASSNEHHHNRQPGYEEQQVQQQVHYQPQPQQQYASSKPVRPSLKQAPDSFDQSHAYQAGTQSLQRRRVRIAEPTEAPADTYGSSFDTNYVKYTDNDEYYDYNSQQPTVTNYNNNNYNQQQTSQQQQNIVKSTNLDDYEYDDDDDIDGVTTVEYTSNSGKGLSWLDRQLGRASKRRGHKDLNERQIKEKAMIEELKQNLKNGAISLRQSFKGLKPGTNKTTNKQSNNNNITTNNYSQQVNGSNNFLTNDDHILNNNRQQASSREAKIFNSGIATLPRNYGNNPARFRQTNTNTNNNNNNNNNNEVGGNEYDFFRPQQHQRTFTPDVKSVSAYSSPTLAYQQQQQHQANNNSQYLQSNYNTSNITNTNSRQQMQSLSSIPSAREVVRSALSRSPQSGSSQALNQTINLLPSSPPPVGSSVSCTPTQQFTTTQASASNSPSPYYPQNNLYNQQQQASVDSSSSPRLTGTRIYSQGSGRPPVLSQQQSLVHTNHQQQTSHKTMDHRNQEQVSGRGRASAREFNELDDLLKSLNPTQTSSSSRVSPAYSTRPDQASFGFGLNPNQNQQQSQCPNPNTSLYSTVQKQRAQQQQYQQTQVLQTSNNYNTNQMQQQTQQKNLTVNVTDDIYQDNNKQQQSSGQSNNNQQTNVLLPSMEDYQNISKLNPVKNHYWYKPNMSRNRAIDLLKDKPQGTFIVRDSNSFRGAFGLAVKVSKLPKNVIDNAYLRNPSDPSADLIRHFLIEPVGNGVRLKGYSNEPIFDKLPALIYQHSLTELALPCKLVIPRADIEDPLFNAKQIAYYNEFLASKEQAKHTIYDATTPNGGYRKYPGPVYVHNEHRIIFE